MQKAGVLHCWEDNLLQISFLPSQKDSVTQQSHDMPYMAYKTISSILRQSTFTVFKVQDSFVKSHETLVLLQFENSEILALFPSYGLTRTLCCPLKVCFLPFSDMIFNYCLPNHVHITCSASIAVATQEFSHLKA